MKSAFSRTFYPAAIILMAALLLVGASFQVLVKNYLTHKTMEDLKNDGATIADLAAAYYTTENLSSRNFLITLSVASNISDADAVICDTAGRLLLCSDSPLGCQHQGMRISQDFLEQVLSTGCVSNAGLIEGLYTEARYIVSMPIQDAAGSNVGIVIMSTPMTQIVTIIQRLADIYLFVALLTVLVSIVLMTILARKHSSPLREMAKVASDFGHGKLEARVQVDAHSPEEMQELALAFNNMASSLQKSEYQRQEFVANVSHELKTPMTTISGFVDGMLDGTIPPARHRHYMQLVSDETKRLSRLVRSMLDISRLQDQGGIPEEKKIRFDMEECAGQVLITFERKITAKCLNVKVDMPEYPVYTVANLDYITQVIYNLLDNAVKFCPAGGELGLTIQEGTSKIYVSVSNAGETIPPEELPLLFDRFHKLDKSRSQNRDGWGLGLYIVKTIICSHGENISVTSKDGKTVFTFTLPLVN